MAGNSRRRFYLCYGVRFTSTGLLLFYAIATVIGPIFAGYIYDVTQSYQIAFITFIVVYAVAGLLFFFARHPKLPATITGYTTS